MSKLISQKKVEGQPPKEKNNLLSITPTLNSNAPEFKPKIPVNHELNSKNNLISQKPLEYKNQNDMINYNENIYGYYYDQFGNLIPFPYYYTSFPYEIIPFNESNQLYNQE